MFQSDNDFSKLRLVDLRLIYLQTDNELFVTFSIVRTLQIRPRAIIGDSRSVGAILRFLFGLLPLRMPFLRQFCCLCRERLLEAVLYSIKRLLGVRV